jgi:proline dehydrogenase
MVAQMLEQKESALAEKKMIKSKQSKIPRLAGFLPERLVLFLAQPYLAGQSADDALEIARQTYADSRFSSTLDILGEDMQNDEECEAIVEAYISLIDAIIEVPLKVDSARQQMTVSMKPSMFSTKAPQPGLSSKEALDQAFDRISRVVDHGFKKGVNLTLEAEDHRWTNFQLESYFALVNAGYTNLGTVLQSRLLRTAQDLKRFDSRMRVRLVIGIYNEPQEIAHTDKRVMKARLVEYARQLLKRGVYVEIASHDEACIRSFVKEVVIPERISAHNFEFQFLQGVPRLSLQKKLAAGTFFAEFLYAVPEKDKEFVRLLQATKSLVRLYLPFGTAKVSGAYCRRRLIENPNMIAYGIKNLLGLN